MSEHAERVLGCILRTPDLFAEADDLGADDFCFSKYRVIFRAMEQAWSEGKKPYLAGVMARLDDEYHADTMRLNDNPSAPELFQDHIERLKKETDKHRTRKALEGLLDQNPDDLREKALSTLQQVGTKTRQRRNQRLVDLCKPLGVLEWATNKPPEPKALLERRGELWCPMGKTGALVAAGGTGKSQALIQLAISVASGKRWLDAFDVPTPGPVVLGLAEEGPEDLWRRIYKALQVMNLSGDERERLERNLFPIPLAGRRNSLMDADGPTSRAMEWEALLETAPEGPWRLVIIDPASRFMGPDAEKDNAAATRFVEVLESWAQSRHGDAEVGPMVLFAHHVSKGKDWSTALYSQGASRGSSAFTDGARWQANMVALEDHNGAELVGLNVTKSNDGAKGGETWLSRGPGGVLELEEEPDKINSMQRDHEERLDGKKSKDKNASTTKDKASKLNTDGLF